MKHSTIKHSLTLLAGLVFSSSVLANGSIATTSTNSDTISWHPSISSDILLEVVNGYEFAYREVFKGDEPFLSVNQDGKELADGQYSYQLTGSTANGGVLHQSGIFEVVSGQIALNNSTEE